MTPSDFKSFWNGKFPDFLPMGYHIKHEFPDRWFRIHSLPGSKRLADTKEEYKIILSRQNLLISDIIGEGEDLILVIVLYPDDPTNAYYEMIEGYEDFRLVDIIDLQTTGSDRHSETYQVTVMARKTVWQPNQSNRLLKMIADDKIRILMVAANQARIISPYDGGVDIMMESSDQRDLFRARYSQWLSARADGL